MSDAKQASLPGFDFEGFDPDTGFSLNPEFVGEVMEAIERKDRVTVRALVASLPAPDQAELFDQLEPEGRQWLVTTLSASFDAEIIAELSPDAAEDVMEALGATQSAKALSELETDDAVHILEEMQPAEQREIVDALPAVMREEVRASLTYPEDSAGRMMRHKLVAVPEHWSVGETIDYLRTQSDLPDNFYVIYTVDAGYKPTAARCSAAS
ncbi:MAG: hypothetical protein WDN72_01560 [Alphaproteobacteria bacterium]